MAKTKTSSAVKNRYAAKAYDRIAFIIPKGGKKTVQTAAAEVGESVNGYVSKAVLSRMKLSEWPKESGNDD